MRLNYSVSTRPRPACEGGSLRYESLRAAPHGRLALMNFANRIPNLDIALEALCSPVLSDSWSGRLVITIQLSLAHPAARFSSDEDGGEAAAAAWTPAGHHRYRDARCLVGSSSGRNLRSWARVAALAMAGEPHPCASCASPRSSQRRAADGHTRRAVC